MAPFFSKSWFCITLVKKKIKTTLLSYPNKTLNRFKLFSLGLVWEHRFSKGFQFSQWKLVHFLLKKLESLGKAVFPN
jgi:hypothetical protein